MNISKFTQKSLQAVQDLEKTAYEAAEAMFHQAEEEGVNGFIITSGYRTRAEQEEIYAQTTDGTAALPGTSEHETGLAIDLGQGGGAVDFIRPAFPETGACGAEGPAEAGADGELSLGVEPETTLSDSTGIWETSVLTSLLKAISNIPLSPTNISPASIAAAARMSRACFIKRFHSFLNLSKNRKYTGICGPATGPMDGNGKNQRFPLWYISTESAARGAVSQRRIRFPRDASQIPLSKACWISCCSKPPSLPTKMAAERHCPRRTSRSGWRLCS